MVGVFIDRSIDMMVGLLGILKAGGAYVPMDPAYPSVRIAMMLEDSHADVVLTQSRLAGSLPACAATSSRSTRFGDRQRRTGRRARAAQRPPRLRHLHVRARPAGPRA